MILFWDCKYLHLSYYWYSFIAIKKWVTKGFQRRKQKHLYSYNFLPLHFTNKSHSEPPSDRDVNGLVFLFSRNKATFGNIYFLCLLCLDPHSDNMLLKTRQVKLSHHKGIFVNSISKSDFKYVSDPRHQRCDVGIVSGYLIPRAGSRNFQSRCAS